MRIFKEEQRFTQSWLIILMIITAVFVIIVATKPYINNRNAFEYIIYMGLVLITTGLIFISKLKTRIDNVGIHYQFFPFHFKMKTIFWDDIKHAKTRTYKALIEYGGWGLKSGNFLNKKKGVAINIKGNIGIQLVLNTDKKILIGTQKQADADRIIARYLKQKTNG